MAENSRVGVYLRAAIPVFAFMYLQGPFGFQFFGAARWTHWIFVPVAESSRRLTGSQRADEQAWHSGFLQLQS